MDLSRVDARDFLETLGVRVESQSGVNLIFKCCWHGYDVHPSARMNKNTTQFLCSTCHVKGNAISFLSMLRDMSMEDAKAHIARRYGSGLTATLDGDLEAEVRRNLLSNGEVEEARVLPSEDWIAKWAVPWEVHDRESRAYSYMVGQRGFDPRYLALWQCGHDEVSDRITIPVRDADGVLVGFKARAIEPDAHPRYLIMGNTLGSDGRFNFHTYRKSEFVFGLGAAIAKNAFAEEDRLVICEGELNVIAMAQRGFTAVGVAGSEFSESQRRQIVENCSEAVVFFDGDESGTKGAAKVARMLGEHISVSVVMGAERDAAEMDAEEIQAALDSAEPALMLMARGSLPIFDTT